MKNRMNSGFIEHYKQKFIFVVGVVKVKNKKNAPKIVFFLFAHNKNDEISILLFYIRVEYHVFAIEKHSNHSQGI